MQMAHELNMNSNVIQLLRILFKKEINFDNFLLSMSQYPIKIIITKSKNNLLREEKKNDDD